MFYVPPCVTQMYDSSVFLNPEKFSSLLNIILLYLDNILNSDLSISMKGMLKSPFQGNVMCGSAGVEACL